MENKEALKRLDNYSVCDKETGKYIMSNATYCEIEGFLGDHRYEVIWNICGIDINEDEE